MSGLPKPPFTAHHLDYTVTCIQVILPWHTPILDWAANEPYQTANTLLTLTTTTQRSWTQLYWMLTSCKAQAASIIAKIPLRTAMESCPQQNPMALVGITTTTLACQSTLRRAMRQMSITRRATMALPGMHRQYHTTGPHTASRRMRPNGHWTRPLATARLRPAWNSCRRLRHRTRASTTLILGRIASTVPSSQLRHRHHSRLRMTHQVS